MPTPSCRWKLSHLLVVNLLLLGLIWRYYLTRPKESKVVIDSTPQRPFPGSSRPSVNTFIEGSSSHNSSGNDNREDSQSVYFNEFHMVGYPSSALSLKDLAMCSVMLNGPDGFTPCPKDPSCLSCLKPYATTMVAKTIETLKDEERTKLRRSLLEKAFSSLDRKNEPVIVMATDSSFGNFSFNLACSSERNIDKSTFRRQGLWVASDLVAYQHFQAMGLHTLFVEEHYGLVPDGSDAWKTKVYRQASKAVMVAVANDLVQLGFHALTTDVDMVWLQNPLPWLVNGADTRDKDVLMALAPRGDAMGPGNSGFVFVRASPKSKIFMQSFQNSIALLFYSDDQIIWNSMLRHYKFRQLNMAILPRPLVLDLHDGTMKWKGKQTFVLHVVANNAKLARLKRYDQWYFDEDCSFYQADKPLLGPVDMSDV